MNMEMAEADKRIRTVPQGELRKREPMARHVTWRAGGAADAAYFPLDLADLARFIRELPAREPVHFVGLGSNLLVREGGLRGTVIFTHRSLRALRLAPRREGDTGEIHSEVGVATPKVARFADYRHVRLTEGTEEWFVGATLRLQRGSGKESRTKIAELLKRRIATQPLGDPNAGSVFRNPKGDYAARMIEACGLKGHVIGGAAISDKHANFIVNRGNARAADIEALIELAENRVKDQFGIALEREVRIVGDQ